MATILDGWHPRTLEEIDLLRGPKARKRAMDDDDALRNLKAAVARCEERGLCVYCGSVVPRSAGRCYCLADD